MERNANAKLWGMRLSCREKEALAEAAWKRHTTVAGLVRSRLTDVVPEWSKAKVSPAVDEGESRR